MSLWQKIGLFALCHGVAVAAQAGEEDLYFTELPIVASVSRLPQKLSEAPAAVTVIDRDMIRASGFRTVEDLLRLVPGFQVTSHNQDPAVALYHGLNTGLNGEEYGSRLQVLIDGRSQYSALFKSGVNWNLLPVVLENIERIEVIRGANTVAYGSNAFMGVVNIITQDSSQTKGWMLSANHGANFVRDETLRWGGKVGQADVRLTYRSLGDEGFTKAFYSAWVDPQDSRQSKLFDLRADLALGNSDELQFTLSQASDVSQYGRYDRPTTDPFRDMEQRSTALGLQWRRVLAPGNEIKLTYSHTEESAAAPYVRMNTKFFNYNTGADTALFNMPVDPGGKTSADELELQYLVSPAENVRLMLGGAGKSLALYSPGQFTSEEWKHRKTYRMFGNVEYRPGGDWLFNLGASLEKDSMAGWTFDPRASASYHITPEHTVRFIASRAHRTPSLYEAIGRVEWKAPGTTSPFDLIYLGQGVKPERMDTLELGYLAEFKEARASFDLRAFWEKIPNKIQILPLALPANNPDDSEPLLNRTYHSVFGGAYSDFIYGRADGAANIEKVAIHGYEYQLRWQPFDSTRLMFSNALISMTAENTDLSRVAESTGETTDKIVRQTRESAPTHSRSAMLVQQLPFNLQASVMYFRSSSMRWRRNGDPIQASERFDWRLAKAFRLGSSRGEVAYTVQNANESQEGRFGGFRYADKSSWLSLRLDF